MSEFEKGQNVNNSVEETAVELDGEISVYADFLDKFIPQQVSSALAKKPKQYEKKIKTGERWKRWSVRRLGKKRNEGR